MTSENWWWIIALRLAVLFLFFGLGLVWAWIFPFSDAFSLLLAGLGILGWALTLASAVAVYFDKRHVSAVSEWSPSSLYYLTAVPFFAFVADIIAIAYLYNRHKHVDTP